MAFWRLAFKQLIIAAFIEILTAQNATIVAVLDEWPLPNFAVSPIVKPEEFCSDLTCSNVWRTDSHCRCDDMCVYYGDCCWDVMNTKDEFPQTYPAKSLFQCRPLPGLATGIRVNGAPSGYFMVSRCPEETSEELKVQCEEEPNLTSFVKAEMFLPIKDESGFLYRNIYCARCNGINESDISIWKTSHDCSTCPSSLDLLPDYKVLLSNRDCFLSSNFQWQTARSCFTGLVDSCPRNFNNTDVIDKCHIYLSPGIWNLTWYKNPHCAICNGLARYWEYFCVPVPTNVFEGYETHLQDDLFGNLWALNAIYYLEPTIAVKEEVQEIIKLSQCTKSYPQQLYLAVKIPDNRLQSRSCPYFGKRLEKCVYNQLQRLWTNDIDLPWTQIVQFPNTDPFSNASTLFYYIPHSFSMKPNWESLIAEIFTFLMRSKDDCDFQDLYLLRVCGNLSSPEEVIAPCDNLLEFNSSDILARVSNNSLTQFLNPWTMDPVKDVSWFAFVAKINESKMQSYKTKICHAEQRHSLTTLETEIHQIGGEITTSDPVVSTRSRLPPVEQIFSNICISLSIICLLLTFITYCVFPSLRNIFGITLMNFVAAFALGQFFIHFVTDYVTQWPVVCTAVAMTTHFIWLATFAWMNLLSWNLKSTFDNKKLRAINYTSKKTMLSYFCYGWIVPLCVASICCILSFVFSDTIPITYGLIKGVTCWIGNGWVAFSVIIGPLAVTIIVNGVLFSLIVNGIRRSRFRPADPEERPQNVRGKIAELLIYIKISLLMGFVWILGFLISFDKSRTLWYSYYAVQALQGILIMLLFAFNRRVRSMWKSKLRTIKQRSMSSHTRESTV